MASVFNRVALIVNNSKAAMLRMVRKDRIVLEVANAEEGIELIHTLMKTSHVKGYLSLGGDQKTWFVTIPQ